MNANTRRAFHQALDIILDALAAEQEDKPAPKRRGPAIAKIDPLDPAELPSHLQEQLDRHMARNGYKKTG